jgi:hypothetical protein
MKILCSISGIEFNAEHFPGTFYSRELSHPIFSLPQKRLLSYTSKWAAGELTRIDSYLLFLALLASSERVQFRVPVFRNEHTDSIVASEMEYLLKTVIKINSVVHPSLIFPHFALTPDTRYLSNVHHWIEIWDDAYKSFASGKVREYDDRKLIQRENALQRMIKNPHKSIASYAAQLAEWASIAGEFPTSTTPHPETDLPISISDYWKLIISRAARQEFFSYSKIVEQDLQELIDHCEDKIPAGSIYSNALFSLLYDARAKAKDFLSLGAVDVSKGYKFLEEDTSVEAANMKNLIDSAPQTEPSPSQYPTKFAYIRAKLQWDMAKKSGER